MKKALAKASAFSWLRNRDSNSRLRARSGRDLACPRHAIQHAPVRIPDIRTNKNKDGKIPSSFWLRNRDSNPNKQSQSLPCCRYTIPQNICDVPHRGCYFNTYLSGCQEQIRKINYHRAENALSFLLFRGFCRPFCRLFIPFPGPFRVLFRFVFARPAGF